MVRRSFEVFRAFYFYATSNLSKYRVLLGVLGLTFLSAERLCADTSLSVCDEPSLRIAIQQGGRVVFNCDATIVLTESLVVTQQVVIEANGHQVTLDGNDQVRILTVTSGAELTLDHLTLMHGLSRGVDYGKDVLRNAQGAAISVTGGSITLRGCTFLRNRSIGGNGIQPSGSIINPAEPALVGGRAEGAAVSCRQGRALIEDCEFVENEAIGGEGGRGANSFSDPAIGGAAAGGALYGSASPITVSRCRFLGNVAKGGDGGLFYGSVPSPYRVPSGTGFGGAIYGEQSDIQFDSCWFESNQGQGAGGGIFNQLGKMAIRSSVVQSNVCLGSAGDAKFGIVVPVAGGGIFNSGELSLENSRLIGNQLFGEGYVRGNGGDVRGGGLFNVGTATLNQVVVRANAIQGGRGGGNITSGGIGGYALGGGIFNSNRMEFLSSVCVSNAAEGVFFPGTVQAGPGPGLGGGVYNVGQLFMTNATLAYNSAITGEQHGTASGGGLYHESGALVIASCTIARNTTQPADLVVGMGSGVFIGQGEVTLVNTILEANRPFGNWSGGAFLERGVNLSSDDSVHFVHGLSFTDPMLGGPLDFGGATFVLPLEAGSPAIDAADSASCPSTDQLGRPRPSGLRCDIGAFERQAPERTPVVVGFASDKFYVRESAAEAVITVQRSGDLSGRVSVPYSTQGITAIDGSDFVAQNGTVIFEVGQSTATYKIPILRDALTEPEEAVLLTLLDSSSAIPLGPKTAYLIIQDENPKFRFAAPNYFGSDEATQVVFTVVREGSISFPVQIRFASEDGSAHAPADYVATQGLLPFAPGEWRKDISVDLSSTRLIRDNNTFYMRLLDPLTQQVAASVPVLLGPTSLKYEGLLRDVLESGGVADYSFDTTIFLSRPILITKEAVLDAHGHQVVLDGGNHGRIFEVVSGGSLTLKGVVLRNGQATSTNVSSGLVPSNPQGAAIYSDHGRVHLVDCVVQGNQSNGGAGTSAIDRDALGGAIHVRDGELSLENCHLLQNQARGGDAILSSELPGGEARGGAVFATNSLVSVFGCVIDQNTALSGLGATETNADHANGWALGGGFCLLGGKSEFQSCHWVSNTASVNANTRMGAFGGQSSGGGLYSALGDIVISESVFETNQVMGGSGFLAGADGSAHGGAIASLGNLRISGTTFTNNLSVGGFQARTDGAGGALFNSGHAWVDACLFVNNVAIASDETKSYGDATRNRRGIGGGIANAGQLTLIHSTLSGNTVRGATLQSISLGGGLYNRGLCFSTNVTWINNLAYGGEKVNFGQQGGDAYGGAIANQDGSVLLCHSTLWGNRALGGAQFLVPALQGKGYGGGFFSTNGSVRLQNTLLAATDSGTNAVGQYVDEGGNFSSDITPTLEPGHNRVALQFGPVGSYGGRYDVLPLLPTSPAIDAGVEQFCPAYDQRGFSRPFGNGCDSGAFESHLDFVLGHVVMTKDRTNGLQLIYYGSTAESVEVQTSTDFKNWTTVFPLTPMFSPSFLAVPAFDPTEPRRLFRILRVR